MDDEKFFTGYCRCLDRSRMVTAELEEGILTDVDCSYGSCIYQPNCPIAQELDRLNNP